MSDVKNGSIDYAIRRCEKMLEARQYEVDQLKQKLTTVMLERDELAAALTEAERQLEAVARR